MSAMTDAAIDATMAAAIMQSAGVVIAGIHVDWVEDGDITYADWQVVGITNHSKLVSVTPTFATPDTLVVNWDGDEFEVDHVSNLTALLRGDE